MPKIHHTFPPYSPHKRHDKGQTNVEVSQALVLALFGNGSVDKRVAFRKFSGQLSMRFFEPGSALPKVTAVMGKQSKKWGEMK